MLTAEMLAPVLTAINDNIAIVVPAGIGVFAVVAALRTGISLFKGLIRG